MSNNSWQRSDSLVSCFSLKLRSEMDFTIRNLSVLAYASGFTLWHYRAAGQNLSELSAPGYFSPASDMMSSGDMVMISARDGAKIVAVATAGGRISTAPLR